MALSNLFKNIKHSLKDLNLNNKVIGKYIIDNWNVIENITIKKIASETKQSPATIVRFCKLYGFKGFYELRKEIIEINNSYKSNNNELIINMKNIKNLKDFYNTYNDILFSQQNKINSLIDDGTIKTIAKLINISNKVIVGGMNINYNQSIDFKNKLLSVGKACIVEQDIHLLKSLSNVVTNKDLIITISLSNKNESIINFGIESKINNATWVHLTSSNIDYKMSHVKPDILLRFASNENELWNLYSIRGLGLFNILNLIFFSYVFFHKNEKIF